ncbi:NPP1-domain-containing protein [Xylariaceae sp. FL0594]|nr:NPP1-domain-containing protein [Xylariaceae sp. FL0594]
MRTSLLLFLAAIAAAAPVTKRAVIDHDAVVGFAESASDLALKYKPWLKVVNGCVPFPAVDAAGNTGGGLAPTGGSSDGCSSSPGQVYTRSAQYGDKYAIMYSWYMPKDSPSPGLGHRHDWEDIIVWLSSPDPATSQLAGLSTSAHGKYDTITSNVPLDGTTTRPKIAYFSIWPLNHQLGRRTIGDRGGEQPLIAWESLTQAARDALENTDFGDGNVPFKDANFMANLDEAAQGF